MPKRLTAKERSRRIESFERRASPRQLELHAALCAVMYQCPESTLYFIATMSGLVPGRVSGFLSKLSLLGEAGTNALQDYLSPYVYCERGADPRVYKAVVKVNPFTGENMALKPRSLQSPGVDENKP